MPLPGIVILGAGRQGPVLVSNQAVSAIGLDQTTYTFSNQSLGAAAPDRRVVVAIGSSANASRSISTVTVAGISASAVVTSINTAFGADLSALWIADVATGTTGNVVITFSAAMQRCAMATYRLVGARSGTAHQTASDITPVSNQLSSVIDIPERGAAIGAAWGRGTGANSATWAGLTENVENAPEGNSFSAASLQTAAAQSGLSVTTTYSVAVTGASHAIASWAP